MKLSSDVINWEIATHDAPVVQRNSSSPHQLQGSKLEGGAGGGGNFATGGGPKSTVEKSTAEPWRCNFLINFAIPPSHPLDKIDIIFPIRHKMQVNKTG